MTKKFKTKMCMIEAVEFKPENIYFLIEWAGIYPVGITENVCEWWVETLEGKHRISDGDFIIKGLLGEFYPCKPEVFHKKYEEVGFSNEAASVGIAGV